MNLDLEQAFTFLKNDEHWIKKLVIGAAIALFAIIILIAPCIFVCIAKSFTLKTAAMIVICTIIAGFCGLIVSGFALKTGHLLIKDRNTKLPEWKDYLEFLFIGFKSFLGSLMYYIPFLIFSFCAGFAEIALEHAVKIHIISNNAASFINFCTNSIYNLVYLLCILFFIAVHINFLRDLNPFSYLNFVKAAKMLKGNILKYFIMVLVIFAVGLAFEIAGVICILTIIGIVVVPFIIIYIHLVSVNLMAQFANISDKNNSLECNKEQGEHNES